MSEVLTSSAFAIGLGIIAGFVGWARFIKPYQDNQHERARRRYGLQPKRRLPEDDKEGPTT